VIDRELSARLLAVEHEAAKLSGVLETVDRNQRSFAADVTERLDDIRQERRAGDRGIRNDMVIQLGRLEERLGGRFDRIDETREVHGDDQGSWKTALAFAGSIIVPILVAIIAGYFALKGAGAR
jgi:hypothetical protein